MCVASRLEGDAGKIYTKTRENFIAVGHNDLYFHIHAWERDGLLDYFRIENGGVYFLYDGFI